MDKQEYHFVPRCDITKLKPYDKNPRKNDTAVSAVANSIREFGFNAPVICDANYRICVGHTRYKAASEMGLKTIPVIIAPHLTGKKFKGYNIADNQTGSIAEWDYPQLAELIDELKKEDLNISTLGFSEDDLKLVMAQLQEQTEGKTDPDDVPELPKVAVSKRGDIWELGKHWIMCADALDESTCRILLGNRKADMVFTDPPYNVNYGSSKNPRHKIRSIESDNVNRSAWIQFNTTLVNRFREYCTGDVYVWGASGPEGMRQRLIFVDNGLHWSATIIWRKDRLILAPSKYQRIYEPCFYGWFNKSSFIGNRKQTEVWDFNRPHNSELHPTMKPVALCRYGIEQSCRDSDIVLDLFLGSGSTLIACEMSNRICRGSEIDPRYCDVIVERWQNFTGGKAKRIKV